jgi:hypothetical protein
MECGFGLFQVERTLPQEKKGQFSVWGKEKMSLAKWGFTSSKDKKRKAESVSDKSNKAIKTAPKPSNDIPSEGSSAADDSEASKTTPKTSDDDSVERFLSHMESEDWKKALEPATKTASFKRLVKFVEGERSVCGAGPFFSMASVGPVFPAPRLTPPSPPPPPTPTSPHA